GVHCSFFDHPPPSLPLAPRYRVARDHGLPALRDVHLLVNVLHSDVLVSPGSLDDRSLVDKGHSTPARTAVCDDQNLVLVTLASARCSLAVGTHDPQRAFTGSGCCARRSGRTLCALRPWRARWARRTSFAFFPRRPGRAGLPLWPLSAARYTNGKCNCNH